MQTEAMNLSVTVPRHTQALKFCLQQHSRNLTNCYPINFQRKMSVYFGYRWKDEHE